MCVIAKIFLIKVIPGWVLCLVVLSSSWPTDWISQPVINEDFPLCSDETFDIGFGWDGIQSEDYRTTVRVYVYMTFPL